ncbi:ABC transporter permease [Clostridia bacterium]|nr:ABC transporter permease [Clostridia bacterium]
MRYLRYILKRLCVFIPLFLIVSLIVFFALRFSGVDPITVMLGERQATPEVMAALRAQYYLDDPLISQYLRWIGNAVTGDFGVDYINHQSVSTLIAQRLPITLGLVILSIVIGTILSVALGVLSSVREGRPTDRTISVAVLILVSVPPFLLAIITLLLLSVFAPSVGFIGAINSVSDYWARIPLPAFVLSLNMVAIVTRVTRSSMIIQLKSQYTSTALAKGLPAKMVIWKHAFRNALIPVLTIVSIFAGTSISGAVLVESVFSLPGLGGLLTQAIKTNNYPIVQSALLVLLLVFLVIGLVTDLIYAAVDPRIRKSGKGITA